LLTCWKGDLLSNGRNFNLMWELPVWSESVNFPAYTVRRISIVNVSCWGILNFFPADRRFMVVGDDSCELSVLVSM
jgi:hypothetical protein